MAQVKKFDLGIGLDENTDIEIKKNCNLLKIKFYFMNINKYFHALNSGSIVNTFKFIIYILNMKYRIIFLLEEINKHNNNQHLHYLNLILICIFFCNHSSSTHNSKFLHLISNYPSSRSNTILLTFPTYMKDIHKTTI